MSAAYRIIDEPRPGTLSRIAVDPMWPLFAYMFGGAWFAWIWYLVNGQAVGTSERKREIIWVCVGFAGVIVLSFALALLVGSGTLPKEKIGYGLLVLTLWKLGITYFLFELQRRSFELYRYFGGAVINGGIVVFGAYLLKNFLLKSTGGALWVQLLS